MIKIIHVSDNHIGASFESTTYSDSFAERRQKEIKDTFFKMISYANDHGVNYIIISGDLFENEFVKISDIQNIFKKLGKFQGDVLIIAGNHDPLKKNSFWKTIEHKDNIHIFGDAIESISFPNDNLVVYGHSWDRYYIEDQIFNNMKEIDKDKINILIAHGDIYSNKSKYLPINKQKLINMDFDYVALGHFHKHDFITDRIAYPGSLEPLDFSETSEHGFIYLELDHKRIETKFIPFSKRIFVVKTIQLDGTMTEHDIDSLIKNIDTPENKSKNFYRIILEGNHNYQINLDEKYLKDIYSDEFAYIEFKNLAKFDLDLELIKKENTDNIISKFIDTFEGLDLNDEVIKNAYKIGLEMLLNSKDGVL